MIEFIRRRFRRIVNYSHKHHEPLLENFSRANYTIFRPRERGKTAFIDMPPHDLKRRKKQKLIFIAP